MSVERAAAVEAAIHVMVSEDLPPDTATWLEVGRDTVLVVPTIGAGDSDGDNDEDEIDAERLREAAHCIEGCFQWFVSHRLLRPRPTHPAARCQLTVQVIGVIEEQWDGYIVHLVIGPGGAVRLELDPSYFPASGVQALEQALAEALSQRWAYWPGPSNA